jgi:hypothetical protein
MLRILKDKFKEEAMAEIRKRELPHFRSSAQWKNRKRNITDNK